MNVCTFGIRFPFVFCAVFAALLLPGPAEPASGARFHTGGVGSCQGCHLMHSASPDGSPLLLGPDASSLCLNCHASGGANSPSVLSPDGSALTPGGDFYWLSKSFSWLDGASSGDSHGHNIVARDFNLFADAVNSLAPGGSFPASQLGCTSCHDPHGQVGGGTSAGAPAVSGPGSYAASAPINTVRGHYRLLGDVGYRPNGGPVFQSAAPIARQSQINKYQESDSSHVDYGTGMSEWCGNCHAELLSGNHQVAGGAFSHPAGKNELLDQEIAAVYNSYIKTGDLSGTAATAYLQFVPFERRTSDPQQLDPLSTQGPTVNANVMCLSCHRAHASAFSNIGRWDLAAGLLVESHPATGDAGATASDIMYSYSARDIASEFGSGQGQFCQKCHGASTP